MKTGTTLSLILAANGILAIILLIVAFVLLYWKKIEESKVVFGVFGIIPGRTSMVVNDHF